MSILKTIGFALIGKATLAEIKAEVVTLTTATVKTEEQAKSFNERTNTPQRERFLSDQLVASGRRQQVAGALLTSLVGSIDNALELTNKAREAETTGAGFMKKKSMVHQLAKSYGMGKADTNLAVELAVRLSK